MSVGIKILVWKRGTNKTTQMPDYTIEIEGGDLDYIRDFVWAVEGIAESLKESKKSNKKEAKE